MWEAVAAILEVLNYLFDPDNARQGLVILFCRIYDALPLGGVFVFDVVEPRQVLPGTASRGFYDGENWVVLVEQEEDTEWGTLTRWIFSLREVGEHYTRERGSIPSAFVQLVGECGRAAWSGRPGQNDAQLRPASPNQGSCGVHRSRPA